MSTVGLPGHKPLMACLKSPAKVQSGANLETDRFLGTLREDDRW